MIKNVKVRVAQSFEGCVSGDEAWVEYTPRVQGLISAGLLQVLAEAEAEPDPPVELQGVVWPPPPVPLAHKDSPDLEPEPEPDDG